MNELPIFLKQLMAQKAIWAVILSGNFSEIKNSELDYSFHTPIALEITNLSFNEVITFTSVQISKIVEGMPKFDSIEQLNAYLDKLDYNLQDYDKINVSFTTIDPSFYTNPEHFFGKGNVMTRYVFDPDNKKWTEKVKYHRIEFPDFDVPMYIYINEFMIGMFSIRIVIPKSGEFKSMKEYFKAIQSIDPSEIKIRRN